MDFIKDDEKMRDFFILTKQEFLESYSYLKEDDYDKTKEIVDKSKILEIEYIGEDSWDRPVYKGKDGTLYKDISLGNGYNLKSSLYTSVKNEFDGEPLAPLKEDVVIKVFKYIPIKDIRGNKDLHEIAQKIDFEKNGFMPDTTTRKDFLYELKTHIEWLFDMVDPGVSKNILNEAYDEILKIEEKEKVKQTLNDKADSILNRDENDITKLDFFNEIKDMINHNIMCYSENYYLEKAKSGYEKEFIRENKKLILIEQMIKEEKQKEKKKDKKKEAR